MKITIHCSDSPINTTVNQIYKWHTQERGWRTIGYHYVIEKEGDVTSRANDQRFRGLNEPGAHVRGHNRKNIGICLTGRSKFTLAQFDALWRLYDDLRVTYDIPVSNVWCHYEFNHNKTCPNIRNANLVAFLMTRDFSYLNKYFYKGRKNGD